MSSPIEISNGRDTVKIYTSAVRGKPIFQLAFYRAGNRERRSFSNRAEAKREAKLVLAQLASAGACADETATTPELESLVAARKALNGIDCPLHVAVEAFARSVQALGSPENPVTSLLEAVAFFRKHHPANAQRMPLNEIADRFVDSRLRLGLSADWAYSCKVAMRALVKQFTESGCDLPSGDEIAKWLEGKYSNMVSRNTTLRKIKALAAWAKKQNLVSHETITKLDFWKEPAGEIEIYTPEEIRSILEGVPAVMLPVIAIGAFAGLRVAEARRLDWSEINLDRGFITVAASKAKTAARRLVPISENLKAWLKPHAQPSGEIAPFARGYLNQIMRAKKLPNKRNALRHSYISYRLSLMPDTPKVALECGNSPEMIFQHYRELVAPEAATAWFEIMPK